MLTILKGRVIDSISDEPIENGLVAFEKNKIIYAGLAEGYTIPQNAQVFDVKDKTIISGFIDCHAHLTGQENAGSFGGGNLFGDQLLGAVHQLELLLNSGFTGVRDMSEAGLHLARGVERGVIRGPRIVAGGKVLGITSGHVDLDLQKSKTEINKADHLAMLVDGVDDCVLGVREQFRQGAKFIKICATGGVSSPSDRLDDVQFSPEELKAMVAEAKRHHTYVTAHCTGNEGAYQALLAGVECIEHGVMLTQREIDIMVEKDIPLVSTLWISLNVANLPGFPDWMAEKAKQCAEINRNSIKLVLKSGVKIALGTDFSNSKNTGFDTIGREFQAMVDAGLTPMQAIKAGTVNAAKVMRIENLGTLAQGQLADIVVVDGNPIKNIDCLASSSYIKFVVADGVIVKNTL